MQGKRVWAAILGVDVHTRDEWERFNLSRRCDGSGAIYTAVLSRLLLGKKGGGGKKSALQITFIRYVVTELKLETNVTPRRKRKRAGRAVAAASPGRTEWRWWWYNAHSKRRNKFSSSSSTWKFIADCKMGVRFEAAAAAEREKRLRRVMGGHPYT